MIIDITNMCSHLQKKLFTEDGAYHRLWLAMQNVKETDGTVSERSARRLPNRRN